MKQPVSKFRSLTDTSLMEQENRMTARCKGITSSRMSPKSNLTTNLMSDGRPMNVMPKILPQEH